MLGAEAAVSELALVREDSEASPLVTADKAEGFTKLKSFDVEKPFKADRRGLFTPSGPATPGVELPAVMGVGLDTPLDVGVKGQGRPANTDDSEELGLLVEAAVELAEKERLVKGADVEARVSLEVRAARGADVACGAGVGVAEGPGSGTRLEKTGGTGVDAVLWMAVTGAGGNEGVRVTAGFGVDG